MTQYNKEMEKDKDQLLEKMLDPDATLTDAELEVILADEELREIHEISASVRGAVLQPTEIDVEQEWRLFRHKLHPKPSPWRWMMRVAAIFLGVLFVSGIVRVGIDRLMTDDAPAVSMSSNSQNVVSTLRVRPRASEVTSPMCSSKADATSNAESTLSHSPDMEQPKSKKKVQKPSIPLLTEEEDMDVEEFLRLQQARIDNELAMMQAELFIDEMQAFDIHEPVSECRYMVMP